MSEPAFNPRSMEFWTRTMEEIRHEPSPNALPVNGSVETCQTNLHRQRFEAACSEFGLDSSGDKPLLRMFPAPVFDLGHEEVVNIGGPFTGIPHLVYATIYKCGHESCRVTVFPAWWRGNPEQI